jgi:uncharacterized membrane protein YkvA (DUF1232 family)
MKSLKRLLRSGFYWRLLPLIPQLPNFIRLGWRLLRDRRVPISLKSMVVLALLYMVSPFDVIPDFFFPGLGYLDDATLLLLIGHSLIRWSPPEVVNEHVTAIGGGFQRKFHQWYARFRVPASRFPPI